MNEVLISFQEACEMLKLSKPTLYGYARRGDIPALKVGRNWRFHKSSLDQWLRDRVQEQTQERKQNKQSKQLVTQ